MRNRFSQAEIVFLRTHYPTKGSIWCSEELNRSVSSIQNKAFDVGLKIKNLREFYLQKYFKKNNEFKVNADLFIVPIIPEIIYSLGLLWADGYVYQKNNVNTVALKSTYPDGDEFYKIFQKTGNWNYYKYECKEKRWKPSILLNTNNKPLANFLNEMDYHSKNNSACKILSLIPENLKHYWFRGLFDGDGHISKDTKIHPQIIISSEYNQNWKYIDDLFKKLEISYYSKKRVISKKGHKSSRIRISNRKDCKRLLDYIYQNAENDGIYLNRKYQRYKEI